MGSMLKIIECPPGAKGMRKEKYVNVDKIISCYRHAEFTIMTLDNGRDIYLENTPEQVIEAIGFDIKTIGKEEKSDKKKDIKKKEEVVEVEVEVEENKTEERTATLSRRKTTAE